MQRAGLDASPAAPLHRKILSAERNGDPGEAAPWIDQMLAALERAWQGEPCVEVATSHDPATPKGRESWPCFHGNAAQTGVAAVTPPAAGRAAWSSSIGLAWYARPVVRNGLVYATSPGMRTHLMCYEAATGRQRWATACPEDDRHSLVMHPYGKPAAASSPVVRNADIVVREMGSGGDHGVARHVVRIDRQSGAAIEKHAVGHADYRVGYPIVVGDERRLICVSGRQNIGERPPSIAPPERIDRFSAPGADLIWSYHVGPTFAEPLLLEDAVVVGTREGIVWCLDDRDGSALRPESPYAPRRSDRARWRVNLDSPVSHRPALCGDRVIIATNDGRVIALNSLDGSVIWMTRTDVIQPQAFMAWSNLVVDIERNRLVVGTSTKEVIALDAATGDISWRVATDDWVRAAPWVGQDGVVLAADLGGRIYRVSTHGTIDWQRDVADFPVFADLAGEKTTCFVADSGLHLTAVDTASGTQRWRRRLVLTGHRDGQAFDSDTIGGGGFHQSSPTIERGCVYVGTATRFLNAYAIDTGKLLWRYELSSAVSGAPLLHAGRVYVGQQGGEHTFLCLEAGTGRLLWEQTLGWVWSSPQVAAGVLIVPGVDGHISGLEPVDGTILWRRRTGGACHPMPATDGRRVVLGSWDGAVYVLEPKTGRVIHKITTGGVPDSGAAALHDGHAYFSVMGSDIAIHDLDTGRLAGRLSIDQDGANVNVTPSIDRQRILISFGEEPTTSALDARMIAFDMINHRKLWDAPGGGLSSVASTPTHHVFGSSAHPYITCVNDQNGKPTVVWRKYIGAFLEESSPAIANGRAIVLGNNGVLHAIV